MAGDNPTSSGDEKSERLQQIINEHRAAVERGEKPDRVAFLSRHPDLRVELEQFLADLDERTVTLDATPNDAVEDTTIPPDKTSPMEDATQVISESDGLLSKELTSSRIGEKIRYFGDYELLEEIARGGMGVVYKAKQTKLNRIVALKMILSGQLAGDEEVQRFHAEAEAAANLDHPGIVPIYEVGEHDGQHYFSMGFVEGRSLADRISESPLEPRDAAELLIKIARAVAYANEKGVIHRDLKPGNVLLDKAGEPRVTDFGLAKKQHDDSGLTATGQILGTPSYMPPEQAAGKSELIDQRADVYALGAILYATLTGRPPFQAANPMETLIQVIEKEPVGPRSLAPNTPIDLETITLKCLEKEPVRRYQTSSDLIDEIERFVNGLPIQARPIGRLARIGRWCKRKPVSAAALFSIAFLLVALSISMPLLALQQTQLAHRKSELAAQQTRIAEEERNNSAEQTRLAKVADDRAAALEMALARSDFFVSKGLWSEGRVNDAIARLDKIPEEYRKFDWRLVRSSYSNSISFYGHSHEVTDIATSSTEPVVVSISRREGSARVWNALNGQCMMVITDLGGEPSSVDFLPDGKRFAISIIAEDAITRIDDADLIIDDAPVIKYFDASSGLLTDVVSGVPTYLELLQVSPHEQHIAYRVDRQVVVSRPDGTQPRFLSNHRSYVTGLCFSPDGSTIATGTAAGELKLWDVATGEVIHELSEGGEQITGVCFSHDTSRLIVSRWNEISSWDVGTGMNLIAHRRSGFGNVTFSPDGTSIAVSAGSEIELLNSHSLQTQRTFRGHSDGVTSLSFGNDGSLLFSGSRDCTLKRWDLKSDGIANVYRGHTRAIQSIAIHPQEHLIASSAGSGSVSSREPGEIHLWDPLNGNLLRTLDAPESECHCLSFNVEGSLLASGSLGGSIKLWEPEQGRLFREFLVPDASITALAFCPTSLEIAAGLSNGELVVWNVESGEKQHQLKCHSDRIASIQYLHDAEELLTASWDGCIKRWNLNNGGLVRQIASGHGEISSIAIDRSNRFVACGITHDALVQTTRIPIYDMETGEIYRLLDGHENGGVQSVDFSPGGSILVSGSDEGTLKAWHLETGEESMKFEGQHSDITCVRISQDGSFLVSGGYDRVARVWNANEGKQAKLLRGQRYDVDEIGFSADSNFVFARSNDGSISIWDTTTGKIQDFTSIPEDLVVRNDSPNGRWFAYSYGHRGSRGDVYLVDCEYARASRVLADRESSGAPSVDWHAWRAQQEARSKNSYAQTLHLAWIKKLKPDDAEAHDRLFFAMTALGNLDHPETPEAKLYFHPLAEEMVARPRGLTFSVAYAEERNSAIWNQVRIPDAKLPVELSRDMQRICEQHPLGYFYNTLAVCYLRQGEFERAIATAKISAEKSPLELGLPTIHPIDLAILAISHSELGQREEAAEHRRLFIEAMKLDTFINDDECRSFAMEVKAHFDESGEDDSAGD